MKLPRDLSGSKLAKCLCKRWGYWIVHQKGSHLILQSDSGHRISIPQHDSLKVGMLHGILAAVADRNGVTIGDILDTLE